MREEKRLVMKALPRQASATLKKEERRRDKPQGEQRALDLRYRRG